MTIEDLLAKHAEQMAGINAKGREFSERLGVALVGNVEKVTYHKLGLPVVIEPTPIEPVNKPEVVAEGIS